MKREYRYENGIIYICNLDKINLQKMHDVTKIFLKRVTDERVEKNRGNNSKTGSVKKKRILDR